MPALPGLPPPIARAWATVAYQGRHRRRSWAGERLHIEVRGLAPEPGRRPDQRRQIALAVEERVGRVPGVRWVVANPVLGRAVVAFDSPDGTHGPDGTTSSGADGPDGPDGPTSSGTPRGDVMAEVIAAIEIAERQEGVGDARIPLGLPEHPADREAAWRALSALLADTAGLGLAAAGAAIRATPLPTEVASLVGLLDSEPHLRHLVADVLGPVVTDVGLAVFNATAQGLAHGPVGVLSDLTWRAAHLAESTARRQGWAAAEPELCSDPAGARAPFVEERNRPVPLPKGPVERYADRAALASVGAAASAAVATGDIRRAAAGLYAGLPKAARLGREVFAVNLSRWLTSHGAVVLDSAALRRLDRIDTVVLDAGAAGPSKRAGRRAEPRPWEVRLVASARAAGFMVVVAGSAALAGALGADLRVPGGEALVEEVRTLQSDGCGVLLVAGGDPAADALWAADAGVGLWTAPSPTSRRRAAPVPWAADVVVTAAGAWRVIDGAGRAGSLRSQGRPQDEGKDDEERGDDEDVVGPAVLLDAERVEPHPPSIVRSWPNSRR